MKLTMFFNVRKDVFCRVLLVLATLIGSFLYAQSFFGSIVGTAVDASGASVPGAMVTLTNTGTGETKTSSTDQDGNYQFLNLIPGVYRVELENSGFKHLTSDGIQ